MFFTLLLAYACLCTTTITITIAKHTSKQGKLLFSNTDLKKLKNLAEY